MITSRRLLARFAVDQLVSGAPVNRLAQELAASLIAGKKPAQADLLISDIAWELEQRGQQSNVVVTSANELTEELRRQIKSLVKSANQVDSVHLDEVIDKSVIGGVRIDSPSKTWDRTVQRELMQIREAI